MSAFEYPRLSRREIIDILAESEISVVSEAHIFHPDPDIICNLYTNVLRFLGVHKDDEQMEFGALEQLENPDQHVHSVQIMNLFVKLRKLLAAIECPKAFTPKDLVKPEADRTEFFLSALMNFLLHRTSKLNMTQPILDELSLFQEQKTALEDRIQQLNAEIAEYEESREKELPIVQELNLENKELYQKVADRNKHQAVLRTQIKQKNEEVNEMDEKISKAEYELIQVVQENANLRHKIVQSPDKLQRALEEKRSTLVEAKNSERAAMQSFQEKTSTLEAYTKASKKISKHVAQMEALQQQVDSLKASDKELKVLKKKLLDDEVLDEALDAKLVELQSKEEQLKEFKRQQDKEIAFIREEATKELNNVKLEVESKRRALEFKQKRVESMVAEAEAINWQRKLAKEEGEAKMQELYHKCEEIVAAFFSYSKSINDLLPVAEVDPQ